MRTSVLSLLLVSSSLSVVGCSNAAAPTPANPAPQADGELAFDPRLDLRWPGVPHESGTVMQTEVGEQKDYIGTYTDKRPEGVLVFSAFVTEYPAAVLDQMSPEELLANTVLAFQKDEVSRTKVEHGPRKCPGLDIVSRRDSRYDRKLVVVCGPKVYTVSVTGTNEDALKAPQVDAFLASLAVGE